MKKVYICVDAGGTTSKAAIFDEKGNILSRGYSSSGSPAVSFDKWYFHIDEAIDDCINNYNQNIDIISITLGVSGISALSNVENETKYFEKKYNTKCLITSDTLTALYSILEPDENSGIIVISGTGVAIFGKNKAETLLVGGWGHLIRERGSSYSIVKDFCVNIIDKTEESIELTNLEKMFLAENNINEIRDFNKLFYQHSKDEIAKLSVFFKEKAKQNNDEAIMLLRSEGAKLAKQVIDLMRKLNLENNTKIGLTGGFIEKDGEEIVKGFKEYLKLYNVYLKYNEEYKEQLIGVYQLAVQENKR